MILSEELHGTAQVDDEVKVGAAWRSVGADRSAVTRRESTAARIQIGDTQGDNEPLGARCDVTTNRSVTCQM